MQEKIPNNLKREFNNHVVDGLYVAGERLCSFKKHFFHNNQDIELLKSLEYPEKIGNILDDFCTRYSALESKTEDIEWEAKDIIIKLRTFISDNE